MCYTSGTTGNPKGVVYSHRALVLQCYAQCMADAFGLSERDVVLSVVPMFHANAWGLPFSATMVGAAQVYPGVQPTPTDIAELIESERVTVTAGVPTVLLGILQAMEQKRYDLSSLRAVPCGGSAVPESLIAAYDQLGVNVIQAWGMTETAPLATISAAERDGRWSEADTRRVRARQGRRSPASRSACRRAGQPLPGTARASASSKSAAVDCGVTTTTRARTTRSTTAGS
jgi:fatty-acyl-CoA synthase